MNAVQSYQQLLEAECFLFDLDGTVYLGDQLLPGARELIRYLEKINLDYYFLTNNSSRSRSDYVQKLAGYGLEVSLERIFSSGMAAALYLQKRSPGARIYLVGTPSLEEEFRVYGFQLVEEDPEYVVLGFDTTLTYDKIWKLCDYVREGVPYIATHPDINCPTPDGFMPDIGAMMALVEASTGREPDVIVGKPHLPMVEAILELTGYQPEQLVMVGDRLYTDIALGASGLTTALVLSGEASEEDLPEAPRQPDFVFQNLAALVPVLEENIQG